MVSSGGRFCYRQIPVHGEEPRIPHLVDLEISRSTSFLGRIQDPKLLLPQSGFSDRGVPQ